MPLPLRSRNSGRRVRAAALLTGALGLAGAALSGCRPADGQTTAAPAVRVSTATPRADSGVVDVARKLTPAVVYIEVRIPAQVANRGRGGNGLPPGFQLPPGFELPQGFGQQQRSRPGRASGSGFIVSPDGYILTNNHVVADADQIDVSLTDGRLFPARVVGRDPAVDVAVIKIDGQNLPVATLGDDRQVQVGQPVIAIGNPLGLRSTVTTGIISAKERGGSDLGGLLGDSLAVADFLQTDAVINPGNSGGPLVDLAGRVVGINSAIESPTGVYAGYGFAVPVGIARTAMDQIIRYGRVRRAILGVAIVDVRAADARAAGLKEIRGALVQEVRPGSGAAAAGLQLGDVITAIDGQPIASVAALQRTIYGREPGSAVALTTQRFGSQRTANVTLREAPAPQVATTNRPAAAPGAAAASPKLGLQLSPVTADVAQEYRLPQGAQGLVVVDVDPTGPSARLLQQGDVIRGVLSSSGQRPVRSVAELQNSVTSAPNGVVSLVVAFRDQQRLVNIPLTR